MQQVYVGIDPSITNTGVVILDANCSLVQAINAKAAYHGKKFAYDIDRYVCSATYITDLLREYSVKCIAYENYAFNSVHRAYSLAEYGGILKGMLLRELGYTVHLVSPLENKKFGTGHTTASKEQMIEAAINECPWLGSKPTDDVCDAYFLAKYAFYYSEPDTAIQVDFGVKNLRKRLEMVGGDK